MHFSDFVGSSSQRVLMGKKNASLQGRLSSVAMAFKQYCKHHSSTLYRMAHRCFIGWLSLGRLYARGRIMRVGVACVILRSKQARLMTVLSGVYRRRF